ncbi:MAG: ATP-binding cassette domain-containing protein [Planctomycetota bacterium]
MEPIRAEGLTRRFKDQLAVDGVTLAVPERSVYGFLGPNGAGKTTTIRMLLGLIRPDRGLALLGGHDVRRERAAALRRVGAVVETPALYGHLTARENLEITRRLLRCDRHEIDRVLGVVDLAEVGMKKVKQFSLGMRQRLGLARAMLGSPSVLILDEPTNGLDPAGIREMRALIRDLPERAGATVLVSSHMLSEVEQIATHVGVMDKGRLLFSGAIADLLQRHTPRVIVGASNPEAAMAVLGETGLKINLAGEGRLAVALPKDRAPTDTAADLNQRLLDRGVAVHHLALESPSLEDLFFALTIAKDKPEPGTTSGTDGGEPQLRYADTDEEAA